MGAAIAWVKQRLVWIEVAALVAALVLAAWAGYRWRDNTAARELAEAVAAQQAADAEAARNALSVAVTNQAAGDKAASDAAAAHAAHETQFKTITRTVIEYAKAHPDDDACDLDGDGLRAWREANAGMATAGTEH